MRIGAGLLGVAFIGAIGVAVYLLVQLNQTETVLASTTANLVETTEDLQDTTGKLDVQTAANVELEAVNSGLLEDKENLTLAKTTLEDSLAESQVESGRLKAEGEGLRQDLVVAEEQAQEQEARFEKLSVEHEDLDSLYETLRFQHSELQRTAGTVDDLRTRAGDLRVEIEDLEERRLPLILGRGNTTGMRFLCTGSMDPALTCLDSPTFLTAFAPEDIVVGATIAFDPNCWEDDGATGFWTVHRVKAIEVRQGGHYYWPRGDANEEDDGCWIPHTSLLGYLIDVQKNAVPENAALRDAVNASIAALRQARATYYVDRDAYYALRDQHCQRGQRCVVPTPIFNQLEALWATAGKSLDRWGDALDLKNCWMDNAENSEYPGHIPHTCPRTGPSPILPTA